MTQVTLKSHALVHRLVQVFTEREEGQDMVEYALLAALISIVAIGIIVLLGPYIKDLFSDVINALNQT